MKGTKGRYRSDAAINRDMGKAFEKSINDASKLSFVRAVVDATGHQKHPMLIAARVIESFTSWVAAANVGDVGRAEIDRLIAENAEMRLAGNARLDELDVELQKLKDQRDAYIKQNEALTADERAMLVSLRREHASCDERAARAVREAEQRGESRVREQLEALSAELTLMRSERDELRESKRRLRESLDRAGMENKQLREQLRST